jgi:hypothetical protein
MKGFQRIIGENLCRINKHILQFIPKESLNVTSIGFMTKLFTIITFVICFLGILILTLEIHCR